MEPQRKKLIVLLAAVIAILCFSGYSYWQRTTVTETVAVQSPVPQKAAAAPNKAGEAVVYISGAVIKPGVYKVASNLRVLDAINMAGGLAPGSDVARVNLAQTVKDGLHIYIPLAGDKSSPGKTAAQKEEKVNINTADKAALEKLPGIGPSLAERIIDYRKASGPFAEIADIKKVSGIGEAKYNKLKDKITI